MTSIYLECDRCGVRYEGEEYAEATGERRMTGVHWSKKTELLDEAKKRGWTVQRTPSEDHACGFYEEHFCGICSAKEDIVVRLEQVAGGALGPHAPTLLELEAADYIKRLRKEPRAESEARVAPERAGEL